MKTKIVTLAIGLAFAALISVDASAAGWGPRGGVTMDPDQPHFGAHVDAGYIVPDLRFQPSVEVGFEENSTLWAINMETLYIIGPEMQSWHPYLGGGVGLFIIDDDRFNDTDTDAGLSAVGGIESHVGSNGKFFTEWKVGLVDAPDFKWTLGWTFLH